MGKLCSSLLELTYILSLCISSTLIFSRNQPGSGFRHRSSIHMRMRNNLPSGARVVRTKLLTDPVAKFWNRNGRLPHFPDHLWLVYKTFIVCNYCTELSQRLISLCNAGAEKFKNTCNKRDRKKIWLLVVSENFRRQWNQSLNPRPSKSNTYYSWRFLWIRRTSTLMNKYLLWKPKRIFSVRIRYFLRRISTSSFRIKNCAKYCSLKS
jgi:hypothetical protein